MKFSFRRFPVFLSVICFLQCSVCFGLDNNVAHPGLTNAAIELAGVPELQARGSFNRSIHPQCSFIDEASVKEDLILSASDSWNTDVWGTNTCGMATLSSQNHAYNPVTGEGWSNGVGDPTIQYVQPLWDAAWQDYIASDFAGAYFTLGRVCHLIEDMISPAHVHGDVHLDGDDFENWGEDHFNEYDFSSMTLEPVVPVGPVILYNGTVIDGDSPRGILHSVAQLTYDLSAFQGHIIEAESAQPDSEFKRMFPSLHFYDAGFFGDDCWEIDNIGVYDKIFNEEWWPCEGDSHEYNDGQGRRNIEGLFYIENSAGDNGSLTPAVFEKPQFYQANPNTKTLCRIYADVLYPEAVSYCAGTMLLFVLPVGDFDFDKEMTFDDFAIFASGWLRGDCTLQNNWCGRIDLDTSTGVDINDLVIFVDAWLSHNQ